MNTRLICVRHGESEANLRFALAGHTDCPLSGLGILQAQKTAEYISQNYKLDVIWSSDLQRAYDTALPVSRYFNIPIQKDERLRELYVGDWENLSFDQISSKFSENLQHWNRDLDTFVPENGESVSDLIQRAETVLLDILKNDPGKTIGIFTHAIFMRALTVIWLHRTKRIHEIPWVPNASVTVVDYENARFHIKLYGYSEHLSELTATKTAK